MAAEGDWGGAGLVEWVVVVMVDSVAVSGAALVGWAAAVVAAAAAVWVLVVAEQGLAPVGLGTGRQAYRTADI